MALVWYFLIGIAAWAVADPVIGLTNENFDGLVNQGLWFIKFYAPWCGHCKKLAPDFVEVASQFGPALKFGEVDCTVETDLCAKERFDVSRFPQMMFFRDGLPRPYNLGRSVTEMLSFGQRVIAPAVSKETSASLEGIMQREPVVFLYTSGSNRPLSDDSHRTFTDVARNYQDRHRFVELASVKDREPYPQLSYSHVVVLKEGGGLECFPSSDAVAFSKEGLTAFVEANGTPIIWNMSPVTNDHIVRNPSKMAVLGVVAGKGTIEFRSLLINLAKVFPEEFVVATIEVSEYSQYLENFIAEDQSLPRVFVLDAANDSYYTAQNLFSNEAESYLDFEKMKLFLTLIKTNNLEPRNVMSVFNPSRSI